MVTHLISNSHIPYTAWNLRHSSRHKDSHITTWDLLSPIRKWAAMNTRIFRWQEHITQRCNSPSKKRHRQTLLSQIKRCHLRLYHNSVSLRCRPKPILDAGTLYFYYQDVLLVTVISESSTFVSIDAFYLYEEWTSTLAMYHVNI